MLSSLIIELYYHKGGKELESRLGRPGRKNFRPPEALRAISTRGLNPSPLTGLGAYTPGLSTPSSAGARADARGTRRPPLFGAGFGLRCFQPLSLRAWLPGTPCRTAGTPEARTGRSFRTDPILPSGGQHPRQIEPELARAALNPAHVPF